MNIDSHHHLWNYSADEYEWINPQSVLAQDYKPDDLRPALAENEIGGTVFVQARASLKETRWQNEVAEQTDYIKGVVGWVDLMALDVEEEIEALAERPKFVGVRPMLQDLADDEFMLREEFRRGLATLARHNLAFDLLIRPRHLLAAHRLVSHFPEQPFVVDHLAKPFVAEQVVEPWATHVARLATCPNVYCKVSGMITEANQNEWTLGDFTPYLDVVFEAFGTDRLMFGSDWPVCLLAGSYGEVAEVVREYVGKLSATEQAAVMGENAARFYNLKD